MTLFAIGYYGIICALLALTAPKLNSRLRRLLFGLCVGMIAATALPFARGYFGG